MNRAEEEYFYDGIEAGKDYSIEFFVSIYEQLLERKTTNNELELIKYYIANYKKD